MFLDLLELPEEQRLWWDDLKCSMAALTHIEAEACASAVEALWLDKSFEHGFTGRGRLLDPNGGLRFRGQIFLRWLRFRCGSGLVGKFSEFARHLEQVPQYLRGESQRPLD